jgi:hypothetical protein
MRRLMIAAAALALALLVGIVPRAVSVVSIPIEGWGTFGHSRGAVGACVFHAVRLELPGRRITLWSWIDHPGPAAAVH